MEFIVLARPVSAKGDSSASAFFKSIVPVQAGEPRPACLPRYVSTDVGRFEIALWSDPEEPTDSDLLPVDTISPYSARLSQRRGKDAKGLLDILFGPSFSGNSVWLTITSKGPQRHIAKPDGRIGLTTTGFRISANAVGQVRVRFDKGWRSLVECVLDPSSRRFVRLYRC